VHFIVFFFIDLSKIINTLVYSINFAMIEYYNHRFEILQWIIKFWFDYNRSTGVLTGENHLWLYRKYILYKSVSNALLNFYLPIVVYQVVLISHYIYIWLNYW